MLERHTLIDLGDVDEQTRDIFRLLQPALVPARSFPGVLSLEVQLGLITMSPTSIAENHNVLTLSELERIVAPQSGLDGTISAFHKRLTTSPRDVDHLVDIEKNGCRLFERYPGVLSTQYEFHCATKSGDLVIVSIDDHGATKINRPPKVLGSVHMSFPTHFWDAAVILQGHMEQFKSVDLEIARAAQHIIDNLFIDHLRVQGNRTRVKLQTRCDGYLTINKVWSKQVTRYRCLESTDDGSWTTGLCLQVTEWQDLFISPRLVESDVVEAECTSLGEMVQAHRQWWEASLVSPGIDAVLEENANLSPGEYTTKWKANDLMGTSPASVSIEQSPSSIAIAIGSAGLGALIRLAAIVVENIDTVGYHNAGPLLDLARTASSELSSVESTPLAASRPASGASRRGSKPRTPRDGDGSRFANVVASKGVRGLVRRILNSGEKEMVGGV
ncbi:hypothetical protein N7462_000634 [Penicillium macrosclerotiorum]|uniref:uncharacterized protein n=1 Tax=Penicillium macrosclerotiorum TaxID=303699 RepID=UPI0025488BE0|nr:uncharacterized protein N7462_000634 [Penicillium macrosclerotiorum]KAJ5698629.1 hypothetical protein N7462_000634 [Penicillium macrosclerotiorum]